MKNEEKNINYNIKNEKKEEIDEKIIMKKMKFLL